MRTNVVSDLISLLLSWPAGGGGNSPVPTLGLASASFYFGFTEDKEPNPADQMYLLPAVINASQQQLRDAVVQNWLDGGSPLTVEQVYARACSIVPTGDPGAALLLCHNVIRAFARGSYAVYWQRVKDWLSEKRKSDPAFDIAPMTFVAPILDSSAQPLSTRWVGDNLSLSGPPLADAAGLPTAEAAPQLLDYTDGAGHFYRPAIVNPNAGGQIIRLGLHNRASIFWLLFDPNDPLGTADPGDWYQYFLAAATAYYAAKRRAILVQDEQDDPWRETGRGFHLLVVAKILGRIVQAFMEGVERYEGKDDVTLAAADPVRLGWLWANALSFIEGGLYGSGPLIPIGPEAQVDANRESLAHREGALFGLGLSLGGKNKVPTWTWYIPRVNALLLEVGIKYVGLSLVTDVFATNQSREKANRGIKDIIKLVHDHANELEPFITDLARQGPGLGDIKAFPNVRVP